MEERLDNKKPETPKFDIFIKISFNSQTKDYAFETNIPDHIIGYGLLEFGKKGVDNHIIKTQQLKVQPVKNGMIDFARRWMK